MKTQDDRTEQEIKSTIGFIVATDKFMSGWGDAPNRSLIAVPFISDEDKEIILIRLERRGEMKRVREVSKNYKPKMGKGDHLHIYNTTTSFRYKL